MSRSFKKNAVIKQADKDMRVIGNRKYRRKEKIAIKNEEENMPLKNEAIDPYSINDGGTWRPEKSDTKWYNKAKRK